ncbi:protein FAM124B isoform X2 [Latimeria chalumnae]|uniref:protein FAM124B isoform X2 n=1 Tax=Latimeria chalumnae TaxID=7897 RepID=UPI0003C125D6|nr:PREDICTED: protein FAM124B isoform X2 [Latimeria chalumnae]|eukprot:XP_005993110.1 PREDICTED: protein FAM124B isoform X2 [Latimeria chalumnae]
MNGRILGLRPLDEFLTDDSLDPILMCVHFLANPGEALLLQQTFDHLLNQMCPEVHLFYVSQRAAPVKYCMMYQGKKTDYPSMSIILFLHEDFGEERILQVHDFFQHSPWQYHHSESATGRVVPYMLASHNFYSVDDNMPIWAIRQVHYGAEILRVTLNCRFDNYEDTVRLYEMILQKDAIVEKSNFCFFTVYSSKNFCIQLSLKQLPPGISVNLKESAVLQFRVKEIGQLVPLLPNPCVPISSTRWQTEDYDGNKILFQVQNHLRCNQRTSPTSQEYSRPHNFPCNRSACSGDQEIDKAALHRKERERTIVATEKKNRDCGAGKQGMYDRNEIFACGSPCSTSKSSSCYSSQHSSPATLSRCSLYHKSCTTSVEHGPLNLHAHLEARVGAETNVDTGCTVVNSHHSPSSFNRFPSDLWNCLPDNSTHNYSSSVNAILKDSTPLESSTASDRTQLAAKRDKEMSQHASELCFHQSQTKDSNGKKEEEFFI